MASPSGKTWRLVLRCYACDEKFTLRNLKIERLYLMPQVLPCPHCSARPYIPSVDSGKPSLLHSIFDLAEDPFTVHRKSLDSDTWHFSELCSNWPHEDFLVLEGAPKGELCNECIAKPYTLKTN
jgi:hypothetical protein